MNMFNIYVDLRTHVVVQPLQKEKVQNDQPDTETNSAEPGRWMHSHYNCNWILIIVIDFGVLRGSQ